MARPNSTLHDIATSIEEIHARLANLIGIALDQGGHLSREHVDRVMTLLQAMRYNLDELAAVRNAACGLCHAEKKDGAHAGSFKEGAAACLSALQRAENLADPAMPNPDREDEDYFEIQDKAIAEIMRAVGTVPPYTAGAVKVLAEYFVGLCQVGQYSLTEWEPEALMTEERVIACRKALNAGCV